jgi:glutathione S-transferase
LAARPRALTRFVQNWTGNRIATARSASSCSTSAAIPHPRPSLFPQSREAVRHNAENVVKDRDQRLPAFRDSLTPLRRYLERQRFLGGDAPAYADYVVFGAFQWARAISDFEVLAGDDPVAAWRGRLLDAFGGLARRSPAYGG